MTWCKSSTKTPWQRGIFWSCFMNFCFAFPWQSSSHPTKTEGPNRAKSDGLRSGRWRNSIKSLAPQHFKCCWYNDWLPQNLQITAEKSRLNGQGPTKKMWVFGRCMRSMSDVTTSYPCMFHWFDEMSRSNQSQVNDVILHHKILLIPQHVQKQGRNNKTIGWCCFISNAIEPRWLQQHPCTPSTRPSHPQNQSSPPLCVRDLMKQPWHVYEFGPSRNAPWLLDDQLAEKSS